MIHTLPRGFASIASFGVRGLVRALRRSRLVGVVGRGRFHPRNTPPAAASCLLPQSADKSAHSKAFGENIAELAPGMFIHTTRF